ncbi:ATP-binding protein [Paenibacillus sp. NRS-1760]|uniref:ATP-binding protein n=1 Tax=Paenibacillus sp. NRS-1760 TaxID=3233902 RepID=UPI003D2E3030
MAKQLKQEEFDLGQPLVKEDADEGLNLIRPQSMYESLRYAEYDIASGLGEIVDNGIEANASSIWIRAKIEKQKNEKKEYEFISEIAVIDNGLGMDVKIQNRCLVLGDSPRPPKANGGLGIGRFGVGLTLGGISLGRRLEVYSRDDAKKSFTYTYIDLDMIREEEQKRVPIPVESNPPEEYAKLLENQTGTIIILQRCDRLVDGKKGRVNEQLAGLANYLGRTYRKFIYGGLSMWLNKDKIYLHDPLYRLGPTRFDVKNPNQPDLKAKLRGTKTIPLEVPNQPGKTADIQITMTLLPQEWRKTAGDGGRPFAKERRIDENQGISILRASREVLYAHVPYITGKKGESTAKPHDRFWGCEISFPPELDEYFTVKFIKRGAEPVSFLKEQIRREIAETVDSLRDEIQRDWGKEKVERANKTDAFTDAADVMAEADKTQPKGKRGADVPEEKYVKELERITDEIVDEKKSREEKRKELEERPYSIVPVSFPQIFFFETVHMLDKIIIKLNVNHPFYQNVFEPLCGSIEEMDEDSDFYLGTLSDDQRKIRQAFMLLLLSYAKSESFFEGNDQILMNLRNQWGIALANVINTAEIKG